MMYEEQAISKAGEPADLSDWIFSRKSLKVAQAIAQQETVIRRNIRWYSGWDTKNSRAVDAARKELGELYAELLELNRVRNHVAACRDAFQTLKKVGKMRLLAAAKKAKKSAGSWFFLHLMEEGEAQAFRAIAVFGASPFGNVPIGD